MHTYVAAKINQKGWRNVRTEVSYKDKQAVAYGFKGSVRLDAAIVDALGFPTYAIDIKTGSATLTQKRVKQINSHLPTPICIDQVP